MSESFGGGENSARNPFPLKRGQAYFSWLLKYQFLVYGITALITLVAGFYASKIYLKPSLSALLPEDLPSVKNLNQVMKEVGGTGLLLIGIESPSFKSNKQFVDALAEELKKLPGGRIRELEYSFKDIRGFVEKFGLHYLTKSELENLAMKLETEVKQKAEEKKSRAVASFLGLADEDSPTPEKVDPAKSSPENPSVFGSLDSRIQRILEYPDDYLATSDGKLAVIGVRTVTSSLSISEAKNFTQEIQSIINRLDPKKFHSEMTVNFSGNIQRSIDEIETVKHDIVDTALLLVALILGCLYFFFQSWILVGILTLNLIVGLVWTLGFAQIQVGHLNTLTAFMSSLVVGTGINYACILISRFLEDRRNGSGLFESTAESISSTFFPTLAGSSTTAVSFFALLLANNRGFSEFALIGGFGIVLCWILTYTLLPLTIYHAEKRFQLAKVNTNYSDWVGRGLFWFGKTILENRKVSGLALTLFLLSAAFVSGQFFSNPYEYDFRKLGNVVSHSKNGATELNKRIQRDVYKSSLSPAIARLDSPEAAKAFCPKVRARIERLPANENIVDKCLSVYELLPSQAVLAEEGPEKKQLRQRIQLLLSDPVFKYSDTKASEILHNLSKVASDTPPTLADIPAQLTKRFQTLTGEQGVVAYVYADNNKPLEDGKNLLNYTASLSDIVLPGSDKVASAAGENFVLADLLRSIKIDGPKTSLISFAGVVVLAFFLTGGFIPGLIMAFSLLFTTVSMFGMQALLDVKFNFLNFIALPLTFGIGVDYPINIFSRFKEQGWKDFPRALRTTGTAVILCSTTTIIGYLTLFEASNQALVSFAKLSLLGEFASIAAGFIALPLLLRLLIGSQVDANSEHTNTDNQPGRIIPFRKMMGKK